jgi:repressor LexA
MTGGREDIFALRVKGTSMIDALINDGDVVVMEKTNTAQDGDMVAVWLKKEEEVTLKKFYREGDRVRLQPANETLPPIYTAASNVEVQGKVLSVFRPVS